jgi:hypothetical protein
VRMTPAPHRISLARGWTDSPGRWERIFHAPTLPTSVTHVRLVITPSPAADWQIQLNGQQLAWNQKDSQLDCDIKNRLQPSNHLVIHITDGPDRNPAIHGNPPFEAYLEIFDEA